MSDLTAKQAKFRDLLLAGEGPSAAYRSAFDCQNMSAASISVEAARLKKHPKIALAIKTAQDKQGAYTLQQHLEELQELKEAAIEANQLGPAVSACEKAGRVAGFYVERTEDITRSDDNELLQAIQALFGKELANEAARRLGYDIETTEQ